MELDLNLIRSIVTVLAFVAFVGIVWRVWRAANRERYAEAADLPFADEPQAPTVDPGLRRDAGRAHKANRWRQPGINRNHAQ